MPAAESELRERLAGLIGGRETLGDFQAWFVPAFWEEPAGTAARHLAGEVELIISEYTSGGWTREQAFNLLRRLLAPPVAEASWAGGFPRLVTGTTSRLIRRSRVPAGQEAAGLQPADIRYAAANG